MEIGKPVKSVPGRTTPHLLKNLYDKLEKLRLGEWLPVKCESLADARQLGSRVQQRYRRDRLGGTKKCVTRSSRDGTIYLQLQDRDAMAREA